jgi:hypothetical protein
VWKVTARSTPAFELFGHRLVHSGIRAGNESNVFRDFGIRYASDADAFGMKKRRALAIPGYGAAGSVHQCRGLKAQVSKQ